MPRMDGLELIARLRKQAPGLPVVLISGFVDALGLSEYHGRRRRDPEERQRSFAPGALGRAAAAPQARPQVGGVASAKSQAQSRLAPQWGSHSWLQAVFRPPVLWIG